MNIIEPHAVGQRHTVVRALTPFERRSVQAYFAGDDAPIPAITAELHAAGTWIACDCLSGNDLPVIHTAANSRGTIYLVRNTHRVAHAPGCPIATGMTDAYSVPSEIDRHLDAIMLEAAARAGVDRVWCASQPDPKASLLAALKLLQSELTAMPDAQLQPYGERVSTHHAALARLAMILRRQTATPAPLRHALLVFPATGHTRAGIRTWSPSDPDRAPVLTTRGPVSIRIDTDITARLYLAAAHVGYGPDGRYEITDAHLYPVLDRGWPVITATHQAQSLALDLRSVARGLADLGIDADARLTYPSGLDAPPIGFLTSRTGNTASVVPEALPLSGSALASPADATVQWRPYRDRSQDCRHSRDYLPSLIDRLFSLLATPRKTRP